MKPKYCNSVVYKIVCLDPKVKDLYVGSTTNLTWRKFGHKNACTNPRNPKYNMYLYGFIRDNGGFENWQFVVVRRYKNIETKEQLLKKERKYMERLNATLNKVVPLQTPKEYYQVHKVEYLEYKKQYRKDNPEWFKGKIECECGCSIVRTNISRHKKTKLHIKNMNMKNIKP